jgi:succinate dehydrogenase/fumarate reductase flavoprotein subunit
MFYLLHRACRAVDAVCREGPARVLELVKMGADFTRNSGGLQAQPTI